MTIIKSCIILCICTNTFLFEILTNQVFFVQRGLYSVLSVIFGESHINQQAWKWSLALSQNSFMNVKEYK